MSTTTPTASTPEKTLEGWIPNLATEAETRAAFEQAFDYRGDITLTLKDGSKLEGYLFDRITGPTLADSFVRLLPREGDEQKKVSLALIARLEFSGKDTAAGKSFETWVKKYAEKKAAGEKNIGIESEKLD